MDNSYFHFDTTSIRVWGDFDPKHDDPFMLTRGFSKDKRPDLNQFIVSMLSVKGGLPVRYSCEDGNQSDSKTSNDILHMISTFLSVNDFPGMKAFIADSALVTPANMPLLREIPFITRLPARYKEHSQVVSNAVKSNDWLELGNLSNKKATGRQQAARYRAYESTVTLYNHSYRAVVFHSSAHHARRIKRLERLVKADLQAVSKQCRSIEKVEYFCRADANHALESIKPGKYHNVIGRVIERSVYARGRPSKEGVRVPQSYRYRVECTISENRESISSLSEEMGCFVLLVNKIPLSSESGGLDARVVFSAYKEQSVIEEGFRFLKDPMILDSLFLDSAHRIEALGLILVISLLIWRLMQYILRQSIEKSGESVEGWKGKPTTKPTSFMMTTKFSSIMVVVVNNVR